MPTQKNPVSEQLPPQVSYIKRGEKALSNATDDIYHVCKHEKKGSVYY